MRDIKFRVWEKVHKIMLTDGFALSPKGDVSFYWNKEPIHSAHAILMQSIGKKDRNKIEIWEGDIVKYAVSKKICPVCAEKEHESELELGISKFCPDCGTPTTNKDFETIAKVVYDGCGFAYLNDNEDNTYCSWPVHASEIYIEWVEVIGNIYETINPAQTGTTPKQAPRQ